MAPSTPAAPRSAAADLRRRHYAVFHGLEPLESDAPVGLVMGNCQAESLRIVLDGPGLATVRVPPVHELEASDLADLGGWLARADVLVGQPVRDGYRGLPLGIAELSGALRPQARVVRVPVIRFAGLYPTHAIVRPPGDPSLEPPLVAYHDLGGLAAAAARATGRPAPVLALTPERIVAVARASVEALRTRERAHETLLVSDLLLRPSFALMRTINHPGNAVWNAVAARVREALDLPAHDGDPGRPLLDAVHAPRDPRVIAALGLDAEPEADWRVGGQRVTVAEVEEAHAAFYAAHPDVVEAGLRRHDETLRTLGLA